MNILTYIFLSACVWDRIHVCVRVWGCVCMHICAQGQYFVWQLTLSFHSDCCPLWQAALCSLPFQFFAYLGSAHFSSVYCSFLWLTMFTDSVCSGFLPLADTYYIQQAHCSSHIEVSQVKQANGKWQAMAVNKITSLCNLVIK